jgi:hypothetical protein
MSILYQERVLAVAPLADKEELAGGVPIDRMEQFVRAKVRIPLRDRLLSKAQTERKSQKIWPSRHEKARRGGPAGSMLQVGLVKAQS